MGGAGLGLVSVLRSVSKLVFNLDPGQSTEVIGLFDMELFAKGKVGARSVHVFTARGTPEPDEAPEAAAHRDDEDDTAVNTRPATEGTVPSVRASRRYLWLLAAILLATATAMTTAVVMKNSGSSSPPASTDIKCPPTTPTHAPGR